ncbi:phosphate ABC transporter substrate-binding/OmpA family protein [Pseudobacteriovorax antillogorgiicola]|uniref:Outer membrane protein OmpA n=1 Tax=Pseudobacteriovorax antillogorgiicola TaxID=1513793 RepID=A0A1Y6CES4_9BACT|nr:phosphate ABC transporter substrate-binding/OmpA family protein [Pseudobacteriovorax antillogorgiicola]TCS48233.1 outer membrane protein OmpA-like peptidoglycan-associated protein [Pseudobacteriovorax antillogorgiicola]SMF57312.1 Outer membrane protein OmpA [Pseudobacteriovorax antillogorgiicola]
MNKNLKIFIPIVLTGLLGMIAFKYLEPMIEQYQKEETSDAGNIKQTIKIGVDSWVGYFPLCSKDFRQRMRSNGYLIKCIDDKADYATRYSRLKKGEIQFAVGTVDSYLINGKPLSFPGTIVTVIDESKGGDAIVAKKSSFRNLNDVKKDQSLKIAFTANSPSEHLLSSIAVHFDVKTVLKGQYGKVETDGSEEAFQALMDDKVEIAVLWEPFVSRALAKGNYHSILSSKDTQKLIVDILIVGRKFADKEPEVVNVFLRNYYRTLKYYRENFSQLLAEVSQDTKLSKDAAESMLKGVSWQTLHSNGSKWFGLSVGSKMSHEYLVDTIESAVDIMQQTGKITKHPLPDENPYIVMNRSFVESLLAGGISMGNEQDEAIAEFDALSDLQWEQLTDVGSLKVRPITFQSGTDDISGEGVDEIKKLVRNLQHYPNFRIVVRGHTGTRGDSKANKKLSLNRAQAVREFLVQKAGIDKNRIRALGLGASQPLPRKQGESMRAYNYRLPRVEINLVSEVY